MSDFSKTTNFTTKDGLASGDPNKVVKGSEIDTEFDNIATASATKANKIGSATNNSLVAMDAAGDIKDSTVTSDGSGNITATSFIGPLTGNSGTATAWATGRTITLTGDVTGVSAAMDGTANISFAATITANSVGSDEINTTISTEGSQSIGATSTWTIPQGVHNIVGPASCVLEIQVASTWRTSGGVIGGTVISDGTNMRISNVSAGSLTVYWHRF